MQRLFEGESTAEAMTIVCDACLRAKVVEAWPPPPCECGETAFTVLNPDPPRVAYELTIQDERMLASLRISKN